VRKQSLRYGAAGVAGVILAIILAVMANWVAARHYWRHDLTSAKIFSLSDKTESILRDLQEEIRVVVFMLPDSPLYDQVNELLARYGAVTDKLKIEYVDPDREPLKTKQLAEQFRISLYNTVVFVYGDRTKYVTSDQMAELDYEGTQYGQEPSIKAFKAEEQFTAAILSLVAPEVPKVYFVTGHGEASLDSPGSLTERGLAYLKEALKRENMETAELVLLGGEIPADADVIAIVGPTQPYTEAEIELLRGFLEANGRLLVALDPVIEQDGSMRSTRLEPLLEDYGVTVHNDLVVDPSRRLPFYDLSALYIVDFPRHVMTRGLEGSAVVFLVTRSLGAGEAPGLELEPIAETSDEGWGETSLRSLLSGEQIAKDDADTPGPVTVALAIEKPTNENAPDEGLGPDGDKPETPASNNGLRIAVFGDADFLSDTEIINAGNLTLALNAFSWLAARELTVGVPPRAIGEMNLYLTGPQLRTIGIVVLLILPGAAVVGGVAVWRRRRH
jgi:hypothetical protein